MKLERMLKFAVPIAMAIGIYKLYQAQRDYVPLCDESYMAKIRGEGF